MPVNRSFSIYMSLEKPQSNLQQQTIHQILKGPDHRYYIPHHTRVVGSKVSILQTFHWVHHKRGQVWICFFDRNPFALRTEVCITKYSWWCQYACVSWIYFFMVYTFLWIQTLLYMQCGPLRSHSHAITIRIKISYTNIY